ncbi:MAG: DUF4412 domain-containing protein [Flavobacteriaceae bacterium]|nr:DUF4412 domain-containing protein [Flavobacteriaceae bacterium]
MKNILTIALTVLITLTTFSQNFEGKITYQNSFVSKMPNLEDEQFTSMMGSQNEFYIKEDNYKSMTDGTYYQWQLYINKDNKLYSKFANSKTILWNDSQINNDSIITIALNKNVIDILGYNCDEIILTCESGIQKYYFTSKLAMSSELFKNHKYGNWYGYLKESNSLPLKMIIDNQQFTMESIAIEVKSMKLEDTYFQLPLNVETTKSPY